MTEVAVVSPSPASLPKRVVCVVALLATVAVMGGALVWMGNVGWPGLHRDAALHATPILNGNNGRGHTISVYHHEPNLYPGHRFSHHGQLYHFAFGRLLGCSTFAELLRALGWLNAITVAAGSLCLFFHLRWTLETTWGFATLGACASSAAIAAVVLGLQGRPEQIIPLIGALAGLIRLGLRSSAGQFVACGVEVGLVGLASPMPGVLLAGAYTVGVLVTPTLRRPLLALIGLGAIGLATWLIGMFIVYPFSLWEWLSISAHQGKEGSGPRGLSLVPAVWIYNFHHPLMIVTPGVLAGAFVACLWGLRKTPVRFAIAAVVMLAVFGLWLVRGGFMYYAINYNLTGLFIQFWLLSFWLLGQRAAGASSDSDAASPKLLASSLAPSALVAFAMIVGSAGCGVGFLRHVVFTQAYVQRGTSMSAADDLFRPLVSRLNPGERVVFQDSSHPSLITLFDVDPDLLWVQRVETELYALEKFLHVRIRFLVVPQSYESLQVADKQLGPFDLVEDHFLQGAVKFGGVQIAAFPPGYQFAVYERVR